MIARSDIQLVEDLMTLHPAAQFGDSPDCPLTHLFAPGVYGRMIFIPAGQRIVGKIHRHAHLNFLMKGKVLVATETGPELLEGPLMMVSQAGTKRVVWTLEDTWWATVHLTDSTDLEQIEHEVIAPSYEALEGPVQLALPYAEGVTCLGLQ